MTATLTRGAERLHAAFARAKAGNRAAFIPFMTAGYPTAEGFPAVADALLAHADLLRGIELLGTEVAPVVRAEIARREASGRGLQPPATSG